MSHDGPRVRDPGGTRTAVLDAAERLFAENGFAATSMRDISTASGVSHPLIHHHFGSKDELYSAVKRRLVEGYARRFPRAARAVDRPISIRAEMRRIFAYLTENTMLLRLCARTRLEGDTQVWPGEPDLFDTLRRRIAASQRKGLIRRDVDPVYLSMMVVSLVHFWVENRAYLAGRFGTEPDDQAFLRQASSILERGAAPDSDSDPLPEP